MGPNDVGWYLLVSVAVDACNFLGSRAALQPRRSHDIAAPMICSRRNCMEDLRPGDDPAKNNLTSFS
jgi:hypothetical protein